MELGRTALEARGSGGARLTVGDEPLALGDEIVAAGRRLARALVARSSAPLETEGDFAGIFSSYVDIDPEQLPKAVVGCWASMFSPEAVRQQASHGLAPGSSGMAVVIQPAIHPEMGGAAEIEPDGSVVVHGVEGPPAPLLQGWVSGEQARLTARGSWEGPLLDRMPRSHLDGIVTALNRAARTLGTTRCEWATDETGVWILQLGMVAEPTEPPAPIADLPIGLVPVARAVMAAPGPLGEALVLPWAIGGLPDVTPTPDCPPDLERARDLSSRLTCQVWDLPRDVARHRAAQLLTVLRGPEPQSALQELGDLREPDHSLVADLMGTIGALRIAAVAAGLAPGTIWHRTSPELERILEGRTVNDSSRVGIGSWEPLAAAVTLAHGTRRTGTPAAPGVGAGVRFQVTSPPDTGTVPLRAVVTAPLSAPNLSQLLWDAAGLVTHRGGPAAHVFESARSLGIPAVCGVEFDTDDEQIVAVDGYHGIVATLPLHAPS